MKKWQGKKKAWQAGSNTRPCGWEIDVCSTRPQPRSPETRSGVRFYCHAFFFSCPFFNSFCLFSFICFALFYLQLPHYLFTRNYVPLHDTQANITNFSSSNSRTLVNQLVDHCSCAMASFWDFKIICAPSIISKAVPIFKKGKKTNCSNYRGISLLLTSYKILSNIILGRLMAYVDEIIGDHQCGFRRNRSANDQIFCIRQILEKKMGV